MRWFWKSKTTVIFDIEAWREAHIIIRSSCLELAGKMPSAAWCKANSAAEYLDDQLNKHYKDIFS